MARYSPTYQAHPACQAYDQAYQALTDHWHSERSQPDESFWREHESEAMARLSTALREIETQLTTQLAADGLELVETYRLETGYYVDLAPLRS